MSQNKPAPGGPGIEPRWTRGAKDAVGTAYAVSSRVWYTLANGVLTEVYYPTIDTPQIRDFQFLVTDGETFFHDERRQMITTMTDLGSAALGVKVVNRDPDGRYAIEKEIIGDPHLSCVLIHTKLNILEEWKGKLRLYLICAPHLEIGGMHNNGEVMISKGHKLLMAYRDDIVLAIGATIPLSAASCGFVGVNDGWTDLSHNFKLDWEYDCALDGNIALTGELDLSRGTQFTVGLGFGHTRHNAAAMLGQSLAIPFDTIKANFLDQWHRTAKRLTLLDRIAPEDSMLFSRSVNLLLAHEDKLYPGAMIASLSIPWGEDKGDDDVGGYHLVWTRDMVNGATALLAVGDTATPLRALIYLAITQREDGGFYQNFWIDGRPYWTGVQLDETSFPIILAWRLWKADALANFDPYQTILLACGFLIREGPTTAQDRWEEASGYSPSTLASVITALICASEFMEARGDKHTADFARMHADFLESHIEQWTVTNKGTLVPGITRHYIRINPALSVKGICPDEDPDCYELVLANQKPGERYIYPANQIVDPGFLELVRFGIRKPGDPLIENSLKVIDAVLKVETPNGPCWKRYNHDGYGQRDDGGSFDAWGVGRPWPLLTLERATYEASAGRDIEVYLKAVENFSTGIGLIPEQIWDAPDLPSKYLFFGKATGAAIPLMWAHGEYVKLLRSVADKKMFDVIEPVSQRYLNDHPRPVLENWKMNRQIQSVPAGCLLRIKVSSPFVLHWSIDEWKTTQDTSSTPTSLGIEYVDIEVKESQSTPLRFTFYWPQDAAWQGVNYQVAIRAAAPQPILSNRKAASGE